MTPNERRLQARAVLARHATVGAAAVELGMTRKGLVSLFNRAGEAAGQWLAKVSVPDGMRVRSVTTGPQGTTIHADLDSDDPPRFEPVPEGHAIKGMSTFLGPQGDVRGQWVKTDQAKVERDARFWEACTAHVEQYKGVAKRVTAPKFTNKDLMTVYPLGDPHIGMLAWARETGKDFDLRIAEKDLLSCLGMLVASAPASDQALLVNLGDFFHAQDEDARTPRGKNRLDVDGRLRKVTEVGFSILRSMVDMLLKKHRRVGLVNVRGNHEPELAHMLCMVFEAFYENEPRVKVYDNANPYTYVDFGKNLIGISHGDGAKIDQLPAIMAADQPEAWGRALYRYWYGGHLHQKIVREFPGCLVEIFRTLATADAWAHWKGYRSGSSLDCITLHREFGEICRSTTDLRLARAA